MEKERLSELTDKFINGTASEAEQHELNEWWSGAMDPGGELIVVTEEPQTHESVKMRMLDNINALIDQEEANKISQAPITVMRTKPYYRLAAAAVAVGIVVFTTVVIMRRSHTLPENQSAGIVQNAGGNILPGSNKAILILSNGQQINLDTVKAGSSLADVGTVILKKDDGELSYAAHSGNVTAALNTVVTPKGGQYKLILPDGSAVWMNAASSIKVPTAFTGTERRVELTGEAYFEVAKNPAKPFIVSVSPTAGKPACEVTVLGTHFNINAYADEAAIKTTLLEGKVKVVAASSKDSLVLSPGQQADLSNDHLHLEPNTDAGAATAWKDGFFKFQSSSIEDIMKQIARWYDVEVVFNGKFSEHFVSTLPRNVSLAQTLDFLEKTGKVHFTVAGKTITVNP